MSPGEAAFQFANDLAKGLITLATGILTLSITFTKDILQGGSGSVTKLLKSAWFTYLLSILFGICTMMALTGRLLPVENPPATFDGLTFGPLVRIFAALQILTFLAGTVLLIRYGAKSLKPPRPESNDQE